MPRIKTAPSAVLAPRRPTHYHVILRPYLQRRFAHASLWTFVVCCIVSYLIGNRWFALSLLLPWSPVVLRGFLCFATVFPVLIIRKADLHVQYRPYSSPISIFFKEYLTMNTLHSVMAYTTSALALTYIYLGNVTPNARLTATITRGYELPRLNERLVYLIFFGFHTSILYGILQKAIHRTRLPYKSVSAYVREELVRTLSSRLVLAIILSFCSAISGPIVYMPLRPTIWIYSLRIARMFVKMPRSPAMPDYPVKPDLFLRSIWLAFLMLFIWESANVFFDTFISNIPAARKDILSARSDDPNGTLITGLQYHEKPFTQACAFEELALIATSAKARRISIFSERVNEISTWNQIFRASLEVLAQVNKNHQSPPKAAAPVQSVPTDTAPTTETTPVPVKRENIFASRGPQKVPFEFVRTSGGAKDPAVAVQPGFGLDFLWTYVDKYLPGVRKLPLTWPFKACIEQQAVVDLPNLRLAVTSIQGISRLIVKSATEDNLGLVQWDLPVFLNSLCATLKTLENYTRQFPYSQKHTPNAYLQAKDVLLEQDVLIKAIKLAIRDVVHTFGQYLNDDGLSVETAEICQKAWDMELI